MSKLFTKIHSSLIRLHTTPIQGNALKRINTLSGLITGMIRKGSSHLPAMGSGIAKDIDSHSKTTAAKRFIDNKWVDYQTHFLPYLFSFLRGVLSTPSNLSKGLTLLIDGSQIGKQNATLMISMLWKGRGIPLYWSVKQGGKGHFKVQDHCQVLLEAIKVLQKNIPATTQVTLLGDGEFDSIDLQKLCLAQNWDYVLRTACNTVLFEDGERFQARSVTAEQPADTYMITHVAFTEKQFKYVNFVCWHDKKKYKEPIYLISNLWCEKQVIEYYDRRYSIECLFKDLKSTSFNIHKSRLKRPEQVSNLLIVAALAFLLLTILAIEYDRPKWRKKVQRVRTDQKVLSFFTFAYQLLDLFIDNEIDFCFSFQFSKKSNYFL